MIEKLIVFLLLLASLPTGNVEISTKKHLNCDFPNTPANNDILNIISDQ